MDTSGKYIHLAWQDIAIAIAKENKDHTAHFQPCNCIINPTFIHDHASFDLFTDCYYRTIKACLPFASLQLLQQLASLNKEGKGGHTLTECDCNVISCRLGNPCYLLLDGDRAQSPAPFWIQQANKRQWQWCGWLLPHHTHLPASLGCSVQPHHNRPGNILSLSWSWTRDG